MIDIQKINDVVSIEDVALNYLELPRKRIGGRISVLCPFHGDKHFSSAYIYPEKNKIKCFVCNKGYDSIDLVARVHNCTVPEAVSEIAEYYGIKDDGKRPVKIRALQFSAVTLSYIGVNDTTSLKNLFVDNPEEFWSYLIGTTTRYENKYRGVQEMIVPEEVKNCAKKRLETIKKFKTQLFESKKEKWDTIRISAS